MNLFEINRIQTKPKERKEKKVKTKSQFIDEDVKVQRKKHKNALDKALREKKKNEVGSLKKLLES